MKKTNVIICALVLFAFAMAGCAGRPRVVRHTGAMLVDEEHSTVAAPSGYTLFWQAPEGYAYDPTLKGNEHIRACVLQAATTKGFDVLRRSRFDSMLARKGDSLLVISEPGLVGVKVLKNGVERYAFYHNLTDEENPCRYYDSLMQSAAESTLQNEILLARNDRGVPDVETEADVEDFDDDSETDPDAEADEEVDDDSETDPDAEADEEVDDDSETDSETEEDPDFDEFETE